ncbi:MAG: glycosyltransferase family 1 protein [Duganella sp.]
MRHNAPPQLLLDLSELVHRDARSGVQRVTRAMLQALLTTPPDGYRVAPVYDAGGFYAYAVAASADGDAARYGAAAAGEETPLQVAPGDIFFGLDLALESVVRNAPVLADLQRHGVSMHFFIHDLLPLRHPEWFESGLVAVFGRWLATVAQLADGLICNSRATADDLLDWFDLAPPQRAARRPLQIGYAHLGADLDASLPSSGIDHDATQILERLSSRPTLLMVGTLEPRKMHAQVLDALEDLWRNGAEVNLVIVGKQGWQVPELCNRLRAHAQQGQQLFWLEHASDELLHTLYQRSSALLAASSAEGFGLPLIEAAHHGLPVIARDVPVFREVGGEHAWYFKAEDGDQLATALRTWLDLHEQGMAPASGAMTYLDWAGSARQLLSVMLEQRWYRTAPIQLA